MEERAKQVVRIDLTQFKLHIHLRPKTELTLHFDSPSRRFYLSVIALVLAEMKKSRQITSIPLEAHLDQLILLNETVGGSAGSSEKESLISRIYKKWKDALPDLEKAPLFKVVGRRKEEDGLGRTYRFSEAEKDTWANLFEYKGSEEHVRLRFSIDALGAGLDDAAILYEDARDQEGWERFIASLKATSDECSTPAPGTTISGTMAFPLPDKPSIAVLPLVNMSEDPHQEYFSDGITEEITTAISKVPSIFVIARSSAFTYKGKAVNVKQVAEELGVRYVLEGSVRKEGKKVRITIQLIDALSGHHVWAERYDRDLKDIFALQDEITLKIAAALQVKLTVGDHARLMAKGTTNLDAYLKALQCREYGQRWTKDGNAALRSYAEEVIALDPNYPFGYLALALSHLVAIMLGLSESPQQSLTRAIELTKKAISLDNSYSFAHAVLGEAYVMAREYDQGIAAAERAVALDPNSSENLYHLAWILCFAGKPEEAIPLIEIAERLNPIPLPFQLLTISSAHRLTGSYEMAIESAERAIRIAPNNQIAHIQLIASYMASGHEKEARATAAELLRINPHFSVDHFIHRIPYKEQVENDRLADALYKAGLK